MNLNEFIEAALIDIALGVQSAAVETRELVAIAPGRVNGELVDGTRDVEFDIAITVSQSSESTKTGGGDAGVALKVLAFDARVGAKGELESKSADKLDQVSRIKFSIPVQFNAHFRADPDGPKLTQETRQIIERLRQTRP